jgi:thiamine-phosphate pyrophosphorylase
MRDAKVIKQLANQRGIVFIVNNRLDIAQLVGADGLHLGQSDLPLKPARRILGKDKLIGISCHNLSQALNAQSQGADYISIGPLFCTKTKPGLKPINPKLIKMISQRVRIPYFVIGGLNYSNINKAISYGARRIALCRAICRAGNIKKTSLNLRRRINTNLTNN